MKIYLIKSSILLFMCFFFLSCRSKNKLLKGEFCKSSYLEKYDDLSIQFRRDSMTLFFWSYFDDTVTIVVNNKFYYRKKIQTNPSVELSLDRIKIPLGSRLKNRVKLQYKEDCIEFTILNKGYNYLNIHTPTKILKDTSWYFHYECREKFRASGVPPQE